MDEMITVRVEADGPELGIAALDLKLTDAEARVFVADPEGPAAWRILERCYVEGRVADVPA